MQVYLVGGAVRDAMLGLPVRERDWLVVNGSASALLAQGYRQVGKDFPVFLHPDSQEEYALARRERKLGAGYHGFTTDTQAVPVEADLLRRDLTINAMARDGQGHLIDPHGGERDLRDRVLRHVSDAFIEDPLRVLRVARFYARFHHLGFKVAPETEELLRHMVRLGELQALSRDRIWQELRRALGEASPERFLMLLRRVGALAVLFPSIDALFGIPNPPSWHPEIDTGVHVLMALQRAAQLTDAIDTRLAVLLHDLGKGATAFHQWPHHAGHGDAGLALIDALAERYPIPKAYLALARAVSQHHTHIHRLDQLSAKTVLMVLTDTQAWRHLDRFDQLLCACQADAQGRLGRQSRPYPQRARWLQLATVAGQVSHQDIVHEGLQGAAIQARLQALRLEQVHAALAESL